MARIVSGRWVMARQCFAYRVVNARDGGEAKFGEARRRTPKMFDGL
jgi:hypothetical protein